MTEVLAYRPGTGPADLRSRLRVRFRGDARLTAEMALRELPGAVRGWEVELSVRAERGGDGGVEVAFRLDAPAVRHLVPGVYYGGRGLPLVSPTWAFAADRCAQVAVFGWTATGSWALATAERSSIGGAGVGFARDELRLDFPYREAPVALDGSPAGAPAVALTHHFGDGEVAALRFRLYAGGRDPHAYAPVLRQLYAEADAALMPWFDLDTAARLAADGLLRWHHRPEQRVIAETVAFDGSPHRESMHVAWLSGVPTAAALLPFAPDAAAAVLDHCAEALAPCGTFWGQWTPAEGWRRGWTRPGLLQARTAGEATLFLARAARAEAAAGRPRPRWEAAVGSNLDWAERAMREDGALPATYDERSGQGSDWDGAGALIWVAALAEAGRFGAGRRAGRYFARFLEDGVIWGAPEDAPTAATSEDGYNAVIAYVALHEATGDERWLELACLAAEWTLTFRFDRNVAWPEHTLLGDYAFRTRGADIASPANPHLHAYGLIATPEFLRLGELTGDRYWLERTRDNLACFLQFVARCDGDFNALRGMATERYYHTRAFGPKGEILPVSHAWPLGLILYACRAAAPYREALGL